MTDSHATCSLSPDALQARKATIVDLLNHNPHRETSIDGGRRLSFSRETRLEPQLRELAELEAECCPSLTLSVDITATEITLTVTGANGAQALLADIFGSMQRPRQRTPPSCGLS